MNATTRNVSLAGALSLLLLSACVSTSFSPAASYDARDTLLVTPAEVRVLGSPPNQAFRTLGQIKADITGYQSSDAVIRKVRERAAAIGADAVIVGNKLSSEGPDFEGEVTYSRPASVTFTAIRFTSGGSSQRHP